MHLPDYERLDEELPDTDIFIGYSLRAKQLPDAKKLKWVHSTASGVATADVPGVARLGYRGDKYARHFFGSDGGAHDRDDAGTGSKSSGFGETSR